MRITQLKYLNASLLKRTYTNNTAMATYPKIIQSPHDTRSYRAYKLPNGCQTVLIHDPKTDKAAAAVSVHVGHYSDPKEYPGLAHFTEHLLFMGTKKVINSQNKYEEAK